MCEDEGVEAVKLVRASLTLRCAAGLEAVIDSVSVVAWCQRKVGKRTSKRDVTAIGTMIDMQKRRKMRQKVSSPGQS